MPRAHWPLALGRPVIEIVLTLAQGGHELARATGRHGGRRYARTFRIAPG